MHEFRLRPSLLPSSGNDPLMMQTTGTIIMIAADQAPQTIGLCFEITQVVA
jgi:hypothetical protein